MGKLGIDKPFAIAYNIFRQASIGLADRQKDMNMIQPTSFFKSRGWNQENNTSSYESELIDLVREIESAANAKGLNLSRWQSNGSGRSVTVRYALHAGDRESQMRYQQGIVDSLELTSIEGSSPRCAAYQGLAQMAERAGLWS